MATYFVLNKSQLLLLLKLDLGLLEYYVSSLNFSVYICQNWDHTIIMQFYEFFSSLFKVIWSEWIL